jgi:hypothetical protein
VALSRRRKLFWIVIRRSLADSGSCSLRIPMVPLRRVRSLDRSWEDASCVLSWPVRRPVEGAAVVAEVIAEEEIAPTVEEVVMEAEVEEIVVGATSVVMTETMIVVTTAVTTVVTEEIVVITIVVMTAVVEAMTVTINRRVRNTKKVQLASKGLFLLQGGEEQKDLVRRHCAP